MLSIAFSARPPCSSWVPSSPRADGKTDDWEIVPDRYVYDTSLLNDTKFGLGSDIGVNETVGWVESLNRFLCEAHDDFWDFDRFNPRGYQNEIFEVVIDSDMSGGDLIFNPNLARDRGDDSPESIESYAR